MFDMGSDEINIKELRMRARLTLGTLADLTGYSVSHIVQLENTENENLRPMLQ